MKIQCGHCKKTIATSSNRTIIELKCRHCGTVNYIDAATGQVVGIAKRKSKNKGD